MAESPPVSTTAELLEEVDSEWERLLRAADTPRIVRPEAQWSGPDVLSHVRLYDAWLLGMLEPSQREEQVPYRSYLTAPADLDERNRVHLERDRALTPEEVRRRALETHAALRRRLTLIPDEDLSADYAVVDEAFVPATAGKSLAFLIAIETFWHYRDHSEAVERG